MRSRYGLPALPAGTTSVLYDLVDRRMRQAELTVSAAARQSQLADNTLRAVGVHDPQDKTLRALTRLGFTLEELLRARAADRGIGAAPFTPTVHRIAMTAMQLPAADQEVLLAVAVAMVERRDRDDD